MYPVNQVFLGSDPMLSNLEDLDMQIQRMEAYRQKLKQLKNNQTPTPAKLIWDEVDSEIKPMTEEQRARLFQDEEYAMNYAEIQGLVQSEILNLVKARIEGTERGKELLSSQLKIVKKLKNKIIDDTNREMELFKKFKEYSKNNSSATYEEFIKNNM